MRLALHIAFLNLLATSFCAPVPMSHDASRSVTVSSIGDEDAKVIYPDYRRSVTVTSEDQDAKIIYPDYRRSVTISSSGDEDAKVIYPDY
ncbi:hypothetical protein T440DRAFT_472437 [Plenodomus tracheiphilus IPT5]|uniref:Uncharacterized protein n=1 Tax=Plenodomus tracheiphilus IPT5 TaxID=1408161 RepID=A0A6A7AST8_9PLEO|nr:hypothetical protein T440DRAFT_472437 [Plenodomus tracheiphilus IPT5]